MRIAIIVDRDSDALAEYLLKVAAKEANEKGLEVVVVYGDVPPELRNKYNPNTGYKFEYKEPTSQNLLEDSFLIDDPSKSNRLIVFMRASDWERNGNFGALYVHKAVDGFPILAGVNTFAEAEALGVHAKVYTIPKLVMAEPL